MGDVTGIEWTNRTLNFWQGCTRIDPGCKFCYMYREKEHYGHNPYVVVRSKAATFNQPLKKNRDGSWKWPDGDKVFVNSWSDFGHEDAAPWLADAWDVMRQRPGLIFQILTKRADRIPQILPPDWGNGWSNVWLGVSVAEPKGLWRVRELQQVPAHVRFISAEPLIQDISEPLRADPLSLEGIHWMIVGGESGTAEKWRARAMHPQWARDLRDLCKERSIAYFFKQHGDWIERREGDGFGPWNTLGDDDRDRIVAWDGTVHCTKGAAHHAFERTGRHGVIMSRVGKKAAGGLLDGVEHKAFPA